MTDLAPIGRAESTQEGEQGCGTIGTIVGSERSQPLHHRTERLGDAALDAAEPTRLDLSHEAITRLFLEDKLPVSPGRYADRICRIASYFARRRRRLCWLSLLVPDPAHKAGVHYAGDYRYPPGWQRCLAAVNDRVKKALDAWGATYVDLDPLMRRAGGEAAREQTRL